MKKEVQEKLMELARNVIAAKLGVEDEKFSPDDFNDEIYQEDRGVFVTLEIKGQLKGCIGNIEPEFPLWEAVMRNALNSAFDDPRFSQLTAEEFKNIDIEISVLTVPKELEFNSSKDLLSKLRVGKDGVILGKGMYKATFLPQVWDEIADKEQFLLTLCMKAGLSPDAWKDDDIEVSIYEVEKF